MDYHAPDEVAFAAVAPTQTQRKDLTNLVDQYALLKAEIADLEAKLEPIAAALKASSLSRIDGTLHYATVTEVAGRKTVDTRGLFRKYGISQDEVELFTKVGAVSTRLTIYGK